MWVPKELTIENFRSIKGCTLNFKNGETYLLQGINEQDEGSESNGSGKSSFREALCYVLGLPIYAETLIDIINHDADKSQVIFIMENSLTKNVVKIIRETPRKSSSKLKIEVNKIDQSDNFATVPKGDEFIIDLLGLPKEDILNHFIISKEKFVSFFKSSDTNVKALINRFSGASQTDGVDELIETDISKLESELNSLDVEEGNITGRIEVHKEDIEEEKAKDVEGERNENLKAFNANLTQYTQDIESLEKTETQNLKTIKQLEGETPELEDEVGDLNSLISKENKSLKAIEVKKEQIKDELSEYKGFLREVNTQLKGVIKCPECATEFNPGEDIDVEEARKTIPLVETTIKRLEEDVLSNAKESELVKKRINELEEDKSTVEDTLNLKQQEIKDLTEDNSTIKRKIKSKKELITSTEEQIEAEKNKVKASRVKEINKKIKELELVLKEITQEKENKENEISTLKQWTVRFKKFRSHLANQSLANIQGFANLYLERMHTNLGVKIEGYKQIKSGATREKITPVIIRNGEMEGTGSYKNYSGGERARVDIAITMAMRHLINYSSPTGGLDLFWIDEITEGVDGLGLENIAESINTLKVTSIITSHVKHEKSYTNIFTAKKVNNETKLI